MEGLLLLLWLRIELRRLGVSLRGGPGLLWVIRGELLSWLEVLLGLVKLLRRVCVLWGHLHLRLELEMSLRLCWHLELLLLLQISLILLLLLLELLLAELLERELWGSCRATCTPLLG